MAKRKVCRCKSRKSGKGKTSYQKCMSRKLKGKRGGKTAFKKAAKACAKGH